MRPATTVLCTVLLVLVGLPTLWALARGGVGVETLEHPLRLTAQYFDRELEMAAAPDLGAWARPLQRIASSPAADVQEAALRELGAVLAAHARGDIQAPPTEALRLEGRLVLLLAATGQHASVPPRLDTLATRGVEGARLAAVMRYAQGLSDEPPTPEALEATLALLNDPARPGPTWASDRLASGVYHRIGQEAAAREAEARIVERGTRAQARAMALGGSLLAVGLAGLLLGALRLGTRKPLPRLSSGRSPAPWTAYEGYALTVRSAVLGMFAVLAYMLLVPDALSASLPLPTLIGSLPMLYYLTRWAPAAHGVGLVELFGLRLQAPATALLVATLVLIAIEQFLAMGLWLGAEALGQARWYEGVQEPAMRGSPAEALALFVEGVLWAPLFEEIACRGLLYTSLRTRLGPWGAAAGSAALFTLPHLYSPTGALALFTGAIASALVYERTRSLLPSIIAHAVNNLAAVGISLLVYRP